MTISKDLRRKVVNRVLEGGHYAEVEKEFGVSVGSTHNFVEDEKKRTPDFDDLRRLNMRLKKNNLTVNAAHKAIRIKRIVNSYGLRLEDLGEYLTLTEGLFSENGLEPDLLGYALRLKQLSQETGMSYEDFLQDYAQKQRDAKRAQATKMQNQARSDAIRAEISEARRILTEVTAKVKRFTSLHSGLEKIGSDKLVRIVQFVPDFEALNYDVQDVKKFSNLKNKLEELDIDPDELEREIAEKGSLMHQNQLVAHATEERRLQNQRLTNLNETLLNQNSMLNMINQIIKTSLMPMPCKSCGTSIYIKLESDEFYRNMIAQNTILPAVCPTCSHYQQFTGWDILYQVAALILPRTITLPL